MVNSVKRMVSVLLVVFLIAGITAGCGGNEAAESTASTVVNSSNGSAAGDKPVEMQTLELTMFNQWYEPFVEPKEDVVTPLIEAKGWKINVKERSYESSQNWSDKLNLCVASNTLPDVFEFPAGGVDSIAKFADKFVDFTDILSDKSKVPNISKYLTTKTIELIKTQQTKKNIYWPTSPTPDWSDPAQIEANKDMYTDAHASTNYIAIREDILAKLGYKFKPVSELEKEFNDKNKSVRLTPEDLKIEPEIKTIADFEKLLKDIKALNLKTSDGSTVIPFGGTDPQFVIGASFGFDFFRQYQGEVNGFYGAPFAKDMHKTLNTWLRDGLLDRDVYLLGKQREKLGDKIALGKYATWTGGEPNEIDSVKKLESTLNTRVRYITPPRYKEDLPPYCDGMYPGSGQGLLIRKDYKDVDKLIKYLDWLYSDEAQDIIMWGKDGGVWDMKDGKKVFKNEELWNVIKSKQLNNKTASGIDAGYYGLWDPAKTFYTSSAVRGFIANGGVNPSRYELSYPSQYDFTKEIKRVAGSDMISTDGSLLYAFGEEANKFNNYFWSKGWEVNNGKLVLSKDDQTFEKNWNSVYDEYMKSGDYKKAMAEVGERYKILSAR